MWELIQIQNTFGSQPLSSDRVVATTALMAYTLFAAIALVFDKPRLKSG